MPVVIDPTVRKGVTVVWTAGGWRNRDVTMWGAVRPGGPVGPMPGWSVPREGPAVAEPRFYVRDYYP